MPTELALLDDLARFLERLGCKVEKASDSLEVSIPFVPEEKAERVLNVFLGQLEGWRGPLFVEAALVLSSPGVRVRRGWSRGRNETLATRPSFAR